jgi:hypothetical protein
MHFMKSTQRCYYYDLNVYGRQGVCFPKIDMKMKLINKQSSKNKMKGNT